MTRLNLRNKKMNTHNDLTKLMNTIGIHASGAKKQLAITSSSMKNAVLQKTAHNLRDAKNDILTANAKDVQTAQEKKLNQARLDRITLDESRLENMAQALENIIALPDPVGNIMAQWKRPNGLDISRIRVPLGVIGVIYESRPNVTADAAALCLKSGNAVILRGSSEIQHSAHIITNCFTYALKNVGLSEYCIQHVPTTDRAAVSMMLTGLNNSIDVIVPRGGKNLVECVQNDASVPVFSHLDGICHTYIHAAADLEMAKQITLNAKLRRPGICGATETLLIDEACVSTHLEPIVRAFIEQGCEIRGDITTQKIDSRVIPATEEDWNTEYLDSILSIKICTNIQEAIDHIAHYGSGHTEAIVTEDKEVAEFFLHHVDSAIVMHNLSTQFADGGEFGMGAEIGIATGRFHARGPVGLEQLTSFKYQIRGTGQTRPK